MWQREALGFTYDQIAANLGVDKSTAQRTVQLFLNTDSVCKCLHPKKKAFWKLIQPVQLFILRLVVNNPVMYLDKNYSKTAKDYVNAYEPISHL